MLFSIVRTGRKFSVPPSRQARIPAPPITTGTPVIGSRV